MEVWKSMLPLGPDLLKYFGWSWQLWAAEVDDSWVRCVFNWVLHQFSSIEHSLTFKGACSKPVRQGFLAPKVVASASWSWVGFHERTRSAFLFYCKLDFPNSNINLNQRKERARLTIPQDSKWQNFQPNCFVHQTHPDITSAVKNITNVLMRSGPTFKVKYSLSSI